jgi:phage-related protein
MSRWFGTNETGLDKAAPLCQTWHTRSIGRKPKPLFWIGSSRKDLKAFPRPVQRSCGFALRHAQEGSKHPDAKPLKGFQGAGVLEIVEDHDGSTYRAVYTLRFAGAVYVLHAFQKKSKKGIQTPKHERELIEKRLKTAEEHYETWSKEQEAQSEESPSGS